MGNPSVAMQSQCPRLHLAVLRGPRFQAQPQCTCHQVTPIPRHATLAFANRGHLDSGWPVHDLDAEFIAQVVGKALDYIHLAAQDVTVFRPTYRSEKYADFVAGGTLLISRGDLAEVGGWRPVPRSVDRALLDQVLGSGGLVYRTHGLGYVYVRHATGNTAEVRDDHFLNKTVARYPGLLRHEALGTAEIHV